MATELVEVELLILVDADGNWEVGTDGDQVKERWEENVGELDPGIATRLVRVTVKVPKPRAVELVATVAEEPATGELVAK